MSSIGAGPTGVELAGQLAELSRRSLRGNFRHIDPAEARVVLLGAASTILPAFPEALRDRAVRDLRDLGVEIHVGTMVTGVDEGASIPTPGRFSSGGLRRQRRSGRRASRRPRSVGSSPNASGVELDRGGRVKVEPDCTLPRHPEVFVIGDLMSLDQLPGVSQVAVQSGAHVAQTIIRRLAGETAPRPFRYRDVGTMATVSRLRAVAVFGKVRLSGFPAWVVWLLVRLMTLTGFKNRVSVLFNWTVAFLGRGRAQRVITRQQVFGRHALEAHARESGGSPLPTSTPARVKGATPLAS